MLGRSVTFGPKSIEKRPQQGNFIELTTPNEGRIIFQSFFCSVKSSVLTAGTVWTVNTSVVASTVGPATPSTAPAHAPTVGRDCTATRGSAKTQRHTAQTAAWSVAAISTTQKCEFNSKQTFVEGNFSKLRKIAASLL